MNITIEELLRKDIVKGFKVCYNLDLKPEDILLRKTPKGFYGDYSFPTFRFAKQLKKTPDEIGTTIGNYLISKNH